MWGACTTDRRTWGACATDRGTRVVACATDMARGGSWPRSSRDEHVTSVLVQFKMAAGEKSADLLHLFACFILQSGTWLGIPETVYPWGNNGVAVLSSVRDFTRH